MAEVHTFSKGEEIANTITHGIGVLFSIAALIILIFSATTNGTAWHVVSFTIFGSTMLILYISSTMVHAFPKGRVKDIFEILDHSAIYFFIAGTYTPFTFIVIQGALGWTMFGLVWGLAIGGTVFKVFYVKKFLFLSTGLYVVMGWLIVMGWGSLAENLEREGVILLVIGGLSYTLGSVFYVWRCFKFHHGVWHLFVLTGSITHFFCILLYL